MSDEKLQRFDENGIPICAEPVPFNAYYYPPTGAYLVPGKSGEWITINETWLRKRLTALFEEKIQKHQILSSVDAMFLRIQHERSVLYKGPLAGLDSGRHFQGESPILVTQGPKRILPVEGPWPVLLKLMKGMYSHHRDIDQIDYVHLWAKTSYEAFMANSLTPGPAIVQCGPPQSGKTLIGVIFTDMLGGRKASSHRYMSGKTDFNSELFGTELLIIDDEHAGKDLRTRINFGIHIKNFCFAKGHSCHGKGRDALTLYPFWRMMIMVNNEPENLLVLPPVDPSIADKLLIVKVYRCTMPMPTATPAQEALFLKTLRAELPHYLHWLCNEFKPKLRPQDKIDARTGCVNFKHPDVLKILTEISGEQQIMDILDAVVMEDGREKAEDTSENFKRMLLQSDFKHDVLKILTFPGAMGTYLERLSRMYPERVKKRHTKVSQRWIIFRAPADPHTDSQENAPTWEELAEQDEQSPPQDPS